MVNLIPNNDQSLKQILQSKSLRLFVKYRLYAMKMNHLLTEDDVINYVCVELIKAYNSEKVINSPLAWSKVVSQRYIISQMKKSSKSEPTELETIDFLANDQEHHVSYEEKEELRNKIKQLKVTAQNIINWRYFENCSWEEIAVILSHRENKQINAASARKRGERALNELRNLYIDKNP
jgi:RNA polymerase sigma factor (sigma-70 family)